MLIRTVDEMITLETSKIRDTYLILTDGHPGAVGVHIELNNDVLHSMGEDIDVLPSTSTFYYETEALVKGLGYMKTYCDGYPSIVANDNKKMIAYANDYLKNGKGEMKSERWKTGRENKLLESVRKIYSEKKPRFAHILNSGVNIPHDLIINKGKKKRKRN